MPKQEILKLCEKEILNDFSNIDDIPYELANTIANIYYKSFDHAIGTMDHPGWIPKDMKRGPGIPGEMSLRPLYVPRIKKGLMLSKA